MLTEFSTGTFKGLRIGILDPSASIYPDGTASTREEIVIELASAFSTN